MIIKGGAKQPKAPKLNKGAQISAKQSALIGMLRNDDIQGLSSIRYPSSGHIDTILEMYAV